MKAGYGFGSVQSKSIWSKVSVLLFNKGRNEMGFY